MYCYNIPGFHWSYAIIILQNISDAYLNYGFQSADNGNQVGYC